MSPVVPAYGLQPDGSICYRPVEDFTLHPCESLSYRDGGASLGGWRRSSDGSLSCRCARPECGWILRLVVHAVDADGRVTPSIGCRKCGWHVWGLLEGWVP